MEGTCVDDAVWPPFCGAAYPPEQTAGEPMICTRLVHDENEKHMNEETGFSWWD